MSSGVGRLETTSIRRPVLAAGLAIYVLSALAGCGSGTSDATVTPSQSPTGSTTPAAGPVTGPAQTNRSPTIAGTPATSIAVGAQYVFTPTAADPDGDRLTFQASNLPSWARLDAATGAISGTPTNADIGTFRQIGLTVSDGKATASIAPFDITVTAPQPATGQVTLQWTVPTTNADGTVLTDLAGYIVRYGTSPGTYTASVRIGDPKQSSLQIANLPRQTAHYFVIAAFDTAENVSLNSTEISFTVQ